MASSTASENPARETIVTSRWLIPFWLILYLSNLLLPDSKFSTGYPQSSEGLSRMIPTPKTPDTLRSARNLRLRLAPPAPVYNP